MPRHRASSPRLPRQLLKGQKMLDNYTGEEIYSRESSTRQRYGKFYHKKNFDYITTADEIRMLQNQLSGVGANSSFAIGQGSESPNYSNLKTYTNDTVAKKAGLLVGMPYNLPSGALTHVQGNFVEPVSFEQADL